MSARNVLIAPLEWGLGHATRDIPIINYFKDRGDNVFIAAVGRAGILLRQEFPDLQFVELPQYPLKFPKKRGFITRFMLITLPGMLLAIKREKKALKKLHKKYRFDLVVSDNRFGLYLKHVPSFLISHQLRYKLPFPLSVLEFLPEFFNYIYFRKFYKVLVPDRADSPNLTAQISHNMLFLKKDNLKYTGIMTDFKAGRKSIEPGPDYLILISGPEPQRSKLQDIIFRQISSLRGKIVGVLGKTESNYTIRIGNAVFYSNLPRDQIMSLMQSANLIISRPGYTTVMELVKLNKKGLFIPTPGQVEQEYLAAHYLKSGWAYSVSQNQLQLSKDAAIAKSYHGFPAKKIGKDLTQLSEIFG